MTESNQSSSTEATSTEKSSVNTADVNTQAIILMSGADTTNVNEGDVVGVKADNEILEVLSVLHDSDALEVSNSIMQGMARVDSIAREFAGGDDDVGEYIQFNEKEFAEKESVLNEFDIDFDNDKFLYKTKTSEDDSLAKQGHHIDSIFPGKKVADAKLDEESRTEANDLFWQSLDDSNGFKASTSIVSEDDDVWNYNGAPSE